MLIDIVLLIIGFIFLIKGADLLVDGASNFAKKFGISEIIIGLTIVAFGTSMPELVVNVMSALRGTPDLAIGNILGSNIANILLILWVSSIVRPLIIHRNTRLIDMPFMILVALIFGLMVASPFVGETAYMLTRTNALILLCIFGIFLYYLFHSSKDIEEIVHTHSYVRRKALLYIALWLVGLMLWGQWIVDSAVSIAQYFWVSERIIWLTIVAVGTSLPELVTSVVAGIKGKSDIAIGNIVGSNIFNILLILWVTGLIIPVPFAPANVIDLYVVVVVSLLLWAAIHVGKKEVLERYQWRIFVALYILYIVYLIVQ